jgi:cobalt-zinc-cadmium efflux system protein
MSNSHPNQPSHAHTHAGDFSGPAARRMAVALVITLIFVFFEAAAGYFGNSLALLTDAGHNITDVIALGLSWYALRLATRPAGPGKTYGYHRAGILAALVNSATLLLIAAFVFYEAVRRLAAPQPVNPEILTGVGLAAFAVNAFTAWLVWQGSQNDLNLRGAFLHLAADAVSTLGAVLAGVTILFTGWVWLDPLMSLLIGGLILWNAWGILRESVNILLEGTPADIQTEQLVADLLAVEGVRGVHDLHIWSIAAGMRSLSAHILTDDIHVSAGVSIQARLNEILAQRYGIEHATLQLECVGCIPDVLYCGMAPVEQHHHA